VRTGDKRAQGATGLEHVLPNLLIAGVPKAGTTSLFRYLRQHPEVCASTDKGIAYFNPLRHNGELPSPDVYRRHFAHCRGENYRMEGTPSYCYGGRRMLEGIKRVLDHPRIVISLRDPVERLWSAYTWQRSRGNLRGISSFEEYVAICERRRREGTKQGPYFGGLTISHYGEYLPDWFELFGADVSIVFAEALFMKPYDLVRALCQWLRIDEDVVATFDFGAHNRTRHARSTGLSRTAHALMKKGDVLLKRAPAVRQGLIRTYQTLNTGQLKESLKPETRQRLQEMLAPSNRRVAVALQEAGYQDFPRWLSSYAN
jgi:hypothetical protein